MSDYKDIWSPGDSSGNALSEEQLLAYLEGRLPEAERRSVEELLSRDSMESDALEGLHAMSVEEAKMMKLRLNAGLQQALHKKRKGRRGMAEQRWTLIAVLIVLMLAALGFAVIYFSKQTAR